MDRQAGIVDGPVAVTPAGLERAKVVREALFALVEATIDGEPAPRGALRVVNEAAAAPPPTPALQDAALRREGDLDAVLSALARAALELLGGPERARVKWCAGADCTRPFVDRSRGARRRWCGMAGCGDRAKAAAYRARQRDRAGLVVGPSKMIGRCRMSTAACPRRQRLRAGSPCGRPQCQPAALQEWTRSASC